MRRGWRGGCARRGIDKCNGIVRVGRIFDVCGVRGEGLRVILLRAVFLLVLTLGLLLLVEFALVLLVFCDAGRVRFVARARKTFVLSVLCLPSSLHSSTHCVIQSRHVNDAP